MLFCFGLFALLLYYTVVANAECSYTYRHSSEQPIEARSLEFQKQGFTRCQFLIELVNKHQQLKLNFTRLTGFGLLSSAPASSYYGSLEGEGEEEEKEEEGWKVSGSRDGGAERKGWLDTDDEGSRTGDNHHHSQRSRLLNSTTKRPVEEAGRSSSGGSSSSSAPSSKDHGRSSSRRVSVDGSSSTHSWSKTLSDGSSSAPPVMTTMWPAVSGEGRAGGRRGGAAAAAGSPCLPMVEIRAVDGDGQEEMLHRICHQHHATTKMTISTTTTTHTPIVFQYSSSVRIVYEWAPGHNSGFTLFFHYTNDALQQPAERCVHTCDDATRCLGESRMLCDGRYDCRDRSDEEPAVCRLTTSPPATRPLEGEENLVQIILRIIVISTCAVGVVVVLLAVCLIGRRRWLRWSRHHHHTAMHGRHGHHGTTHSCLQSHSSESSVTRACSAQECSEQAVALLPSSHRSHISWPSSSQSHSHPPPDPPHPTGDSRIQMPPNIPVSPDGEEGYAASQLGLRHPRYHSAHSDLLFRPPPNKTVYDRESPPPYSVSPSSHSPGTYGSRSEPCPYPVELRQGGQSWSGHERIMRDSVRQSTTVSRCRSMISPLDPDHQPPHPSVKGHPHSSHHHPHHHLPCSSANQGCARSDPQRLPLLHGACRKTDLQSSPSPSPTEPPVSSRVVPAISFSSLTTCSPAVSSSSSPAFSSSVSSSCPAALLPPSSSSSSREAAAPVVSTASESRTMLPCQLVCAADVGQDRDSSSDSCSGESIADDRPRAHHHHPQLGAPSPNPPPSCQGVLGWTTRKGEDAT